MKNNLEMSNAMKLDVTETTVLFCIMKILNLLFININF